MNIDKVVLVAFKKTPGGNEVLVYKPKGSDIWLLPNTTSEGQINKTKNEVLDLAEIYKVEKNQIDQIILDLNVLIYESTHYKAFAVFTNPDAVPNIKFDFMQEISYQPVDLVITKTISPYKEFLAEISNITIL